MRRERTVKEEMEICVMKAAYYKGLDPILQKQWEVWVEALQWVLNE